MTDLTLSDVSKKMRKIDICMMTTKTTLGLISCRPMLNYTEPEYDGNSYFFSLEDADVIKELKADNVVNLSFQNDGKFYASMLGHATISNTKEELEAHWIDSLNKWFEDGLNTPGITLIHVKADTVKYWDSARSGEITIQEVK